MLSTIMRPIILISTGLGSVGALTGTGIAINHFYGGESIRAYIEKTKTSKNKVFLTSKTPSLSEIQEKYEVSKRTKPKKNGVDVPKKELGRWCENAVKEKFKDENDDIFKGIISWCYINTNSLKEEITNSGKEILSSQAGGHDDWKAAWRKYKAGRDTKGFKIEESNFGDLNKDVEDAGAKALHGWCTAKKNETKKLYEDGIENAFFLFVKWCAK